MEAIVEGLLYVQGDLGLKLEDIMDILEVDKETARDVVLNLKKYYDDNNRGLRINYLGNTFKLTTREEHKDYYKKLVESPRNSSLSASSLEVLAIIAYNAPITRGMIEEIRGVDSTYVIRRLLARGLIKECGKSDLPGKPILYKTTDDFLDYFGLSSIDDLPSIPEIEEGDSTETDLYTSIYKENENNGWQNYNRRRKGRR